MKDVLSSDIVIVLLGTSVVILTAILINRRRNASKSSSRDPWGSGEKSRMSSDYIYIDQ